MSHPEQVKPVPDAEMVPVPVSGVVRANIEHDLNTQAQAADFGAWSTYSVTATGPAQQILPFDPSRARALIIVSGTGPVYVGTQAQCQASPPVGGQLPTGTYEVKNNQKLWLVSDGSHTATVTVLMERWES